AARRVATGIASPPSAGPNASPTALRWAATVAGSGTMFAKTAPATVSGWIPAQLAVQCVYRALGSSGGFAAGGGDFCGFAAFGFGGFLLTCRDISGSSSAASCSLCKGAPEASPAQCRGNVSPKSGNLPRDMGPVPPRGRPGPPRCASALAGGVAGL